MMKIINAEDVPALEYMCRPALRTCAGVTCCARAVPHQRHIPHSARTCTVVSPCYADTICTKIRPPAAAVADTVT